MTINHFDVLRRVGNDVESRGHLFIDSPLHRQDQLLAEFTDKDRSEIGWRLQITMNGQAATQLRDQDA